MQMVNCLQCWAQRLEMLEKLVEEDDDGKARSLSDGFLADAHVELALTGLAIDDACRLFERAGRKRGRYDRLEWMPGGRHKLLHGRRGGVIVERGRAKELTCERVMTAPTISEDDVSRALFLEGAEEWVRENQPDYSYGASFGGDGFGDLYDGVEDLTAVSFEPDDDVAIAESFDDDQTMAEVEELFAETEIPHFNGRIVEGAPTYDQNDPDVIRKAWNTQVVARGQHEPDPTVVIEKEFGFDATLWKRSIGQPHSRKKKAGREEFPMLGHATA